MITEDEFEALTAQIAKLVEPMIGHLTDYEIDRVMTHTAGIVQERVPLARSPDHDRDDIPF
jgi:hypothetical protein